MALLRHLGQRYGRPLLWNVSAYTPILQSRGVKLDTGIVGLKVVPNAREVLKDRLIDLLESVTEQIPAEAEYRKAVEATVKYRCAWASLQDLPNEALSRASFLQIVAFPCSSYIMLSAHMLQQPPGTASRGGRGACRLTSNSLPSRDNCHAWRTG